MCVCVCVCVYIWQIYPEYVKNVCTSRIRTWTFQLKLRNIWINTFQNCSMHRSFFFPYPKVHVLKHFILFWGLSWGLNKVSYPLPHPAILRPYRKQQAAHSLKQRWRDEPVEPHIMLQHKRRPTGSEGQGKGLAPAEWAIPGRLSEEGRRAYPFLRRLRSGGKLP